MTARIPAPALTHVGLLTDDIETLVEVWESLFRVRRTERRPTWYASDEGVLATYLPFPGAPVEPLQPLDVGTMQHRLLEAGVRAFHLSLVVPDIHASVAGLRARGVWTQLRRPGRTVTLHRAWVDRADAHGATIELIDATELAAFRPAGSAQPVDHDRLAPTLRCVGLVVDDLAATVDMYTAALGFRAQASEKVQVLGEEAQMVQLRPATGPAVEVVQGRSPARLAHRLGMPLQGIAYLGFESSAPAELGRHLDVAEAWTTEVRTDDSLDELWVHPNSTRGIAVRIRPARDVEDVNP